MSNKSAKSSESQIVQPWEDTSERDFATKTQPCIDTSIADDSRDDMYDRSQQTSETDTCLENTSLELAKTLRFGSPYLTSDGVQKAISDTFKELKKVPFKANQVDTSNEVCSGNAYHCIFMQNYNVLL